MNVEFEIYYSGWVEQWTPSDATPQYTTVFMDNFLPTKKNILLEFSDYDNWTDIARVLNSEENHFANTLLMFCRGFSAIHIVSLHNSFFSFRFCIVAIICGQSYRHFWHWFMLFLFFALLACKRMKRAVKKIYWLVRICCEFSEDIKNGRARLRTRRVLVPTLCQKCNKHLWPHTNYYNSLTAQHPFYRKMWKFSKHHANRLI